MPKAYYRVCPQIRHTKNVLRLSCALVLAGVLAISGTVVPPPAAADSRQTAASSIAQAHAEQSAAPDETAAVRTPTDDLQADADGAALAAATTSAVSVQAGPAQAGPAAADSPPAASAEPGAPSVVPVEAVADPTLGSMIAADPADPAPDARPAAPADSAAAPLAARAGALVPLPEAKPTVSNLVLLLRFAGDSTGDGQTGYNKPNPFKPEVGTAWQGLMYEYNGGYSTDYYDRNMHYYFDAVSGSKEQLTSYFPQTRSDGGVDYLTLPHASDYYADDPNDFSLAQDALAEFNKAYPDFDASILDADGNGEVDNVTFLLTLPTVPQPGDKFWPHMYPLGGNGLVVGSGSKSKLLADCNVIDTGNRDTWTVGLMSHEFMHTLGAMDYYRQPGVRTGVPVGRWDIMSVANSPLFWPLAQTRQDLGWTDIPEKTQSGTYTLSAPGTGKPQSLLFKTSLSDSEYFVVEYRKQGSDVSGDMDSRIGGSGVVVYRVNPAYKQWGNFGADDYVYIFRPGETALGAGEGDVTHAQVSMPDDPNFKRQSVGSADPKASVEGGAIVYSDGRNSGAVVSAVSQTEDSLTFTLTLAEKPGGSGTWDVAPNGGGPTSFGAEVQSVSTATDGRTLYASIMQGQGSDAGQSYQVMAYEGGKWADLGAAIDGETLDGGTIAVQGGALYFCGFDYASDAAQGVELKRWNKESRSWEHVARAFTSAYVSDFALKSVAGSLYLVVDQASSPPGESPGSAPRAYRLNAAQASLEPVGEALPTASIRAPSLVDVGGQPAVVCGNGDAATYLYRFDGSSWHSTALSASVSAGFSDAVSADDRAYVLADSGTDGAACLYTIGADGSLVESASVPWLAPTGLNVGMASLRLDGSYLYATIADIQDFSTLSGPVNTFATKRERVSADQSAWQQVGDTVSFSAKGASACIVGNTVYVASVDLPANKASFRMRPTLPEPSIISVTMPSSASFTVDPGKVGDPSAQIKGPDNLVITNNSAFPVWVGISAVSVQGVSLVDSEAGLSADSSLMLALSDQMPSGFDQVADWLPAASETSPASGIRYLPFNRAGSGMIAAAVNGVGTDSPAIKLYGKASANWGGAHARFTVTPTFTVTSTNPAIP